MPFSNDKKTFLSKLDKSKKGSIDEKIIPLINLINSNENYYTTSSCSGRVYLWRGTGKKNETEWLKVSHELITEEFFTIPRTNDVVWLRVEPLILHVCCIDLKQANFFLELVKTVYKKSSLLSFQNKIVVEVRGSEFVEMPFYQEGKILFNKDLAWMINLINEKLTLMWNKQHKLEKKIM